MTEAFFTNIRNTSEECLVHLLDCCTYALFRQGKNGNLLSDYIARGKQVSAKKMAIDGHVHDLIT